MLKIGSNKTLARWTITRVSQDGFDCLAHSIDLVRKIYSNEWDCVICHNELNDSQLQFLERVGVPMIAQENFSNSLPISPSGNGWKLYPPRLRKTAYEIFVDNDLVISKRHHIIAEAIKTNKPIMCEALERAFGRYDGMVPLGKKLNSGLIGLPPMFDFQAKLTKLISFRWIDHIDTKWNDVRGHFDEQGLVAAALHEECLVLPISDFQVCKREYKPDRFGSHFVGLNYGLNMFWNEYKKTARAGTLAV
jgi:hypothetical protein